MGAAMQRPKLVAIPSKERAITDNLPAQLTPLIGREHEVAEACILLRSPDVRLVTLTGTGGVGKTRLALQVAAGLLDDFPDGVSFVPLAPISDPDLVVPTIAQALDVKESGTRSMLDLLKAFLKDKHLLLVLDNFEQILPAAPHLTDLLTSCPELKLLVTSRAVLHVQGEHEFSVPPLALPDLKQLPPIGALSHYAAVALFLQRARVVKPTFEVTPANARLIAEICAHLDGLPLALELAAARIKLLTPQALLARLEHRLQVLTGGTQDAPTRQQTLRNTIDWSYHLLTPSEQHLFRRLSVFVGGCTLEAIEVLYKVLDGKLTNVFDTVASLLDKSLLQQTEYEDDEPRFGMLETLREYGLEALEASEEMEAVRQAHATYYLALVEQAEPELDGPQQAVWREHLEQEYGNLRAAIQWSLKQGKAGDSMEMALRLGGALSEFWSVRGYRSEGRSILDRALAGSKGARTPVRAKALVTAGELALGLGDREGAESLFEESLTLYKGFGDARGMAHVLNGLGRIAVDKGELRIARSLYEQALVLQREMGDKVDVAWSLHDLAYLAFDRGEYTEARTLFEESLAIQQELGNTRGIAWSRAGLAQVLFLSQGHHATTRAQFEECLEIFRESGDKVGVAFCFSLLGQVALYQGDAAIACSLAEEGVTLYKEMGNRPGAAWSRFLLARALAFKGDHVAARALYEESLTEARATGEKLDIVHNLEGLAGVVAAQGELTWAARLWGTAEALRDPMGTPLPPVYRAGYDQSVAAARAQLGEKAFAAAWAEGHAMTPDQALAAQGPVTLPTPTSAERTSTSPTKPVITYPNDLTAREVEVLRLLAQGLTDTQIAEQLVISPRTVNTHLTSIYGKIQVSSRSGATRYAVDHRLV
jgi:predicted ATPase/DNA-binding CsgD family transcriptional regulator